MSADFLMKVTSEVVDMQELSMLCMDWVSGVPREERRTKFLFPAPDKKTAFIPSDIWDTVFTRLSKADVVSLGKVRPAYTALCSSVDNSSTISLNTLYEALNTASGNKVFKVTSMRNIELDGSHTYDVVTERGEGIGGLL